MSKERDEMEKDMGEVYVAVADNPDDDAACDNYATAAAVLRDLKKIGKADSDDTVNVIRKPLFVSIEQYREWASMEDVEVDDTDTKEVEE